uniref:Amino acid transporter transmembrane domain-containing protein n=1 Tax=Chenopodium quinoa TaxID=63459 RepID=A0A803M679_CHEQI
MLKFFRSSSVVPLEGFEMDSKQWREVPLPPKKEFDVFYSNIVLESKGWGGGLLCLSAGALVTFYSYTLLSLVLEHHAQLGRRQLHFRAMAHDILGPSWGKYFVGPIQLAVCYGSVVAACLLGGQCIKAIYLLTNPDGEMKLRYFVIVFGGLMLILAQMPSFHSLRHINLTSLILCLAYSACTTAASIYVGINNNASEESKTDYSVVGKTKDRIYGVFSAIAIIATTFGNGMIPEIQATIVPPVKEKMFKGLILCYTIVLATIFSVAVSGYWAFGNKSHGQILSNFVVNGNPLLPRWFVIMTITFVTFQLAAFGVVYMQPTNEVLENLLSDPKSHPFSQRNVIPRVLSRFIFVASATFLAAVLPFFGDIMGIIGAFGFLPLDFALPVIFYNITFRPSMRSFIFWANLVVMGLFFVLVVVGYAAAIREIVLDANFFRLFPHL